MGFIPPPRALTKEEFEERWAKGARTMAELDPSLAQWYKDGERDTRIKMFVLIGCGALVVLSIIVAVSLRLYMGITPG